MKNRKLFCQYGKVPYYISLYKEYLKRDLSDLFKGNKFANKRAREDFEYIWKSDAKIIKRKLHGVDMQLQENKVVNLDIAGKEINNIIVNPGEIFSFWKLVGKPTKRKGYLQGLIIKTGEFGSFVGGGLCQMANLVHYLVLHTDLEVVELHHHSNALFPDSQRKVPFGTGTSIAYKNVDYRFKNNLDVPIQIKVWQDGTMLYGEIRAPKPQENKYKLVEEDSHYKKEADGIFYRNSKVYKVRIDKDTKEEIDRKLILENHSKVMYDYDLIPKDEIRWE